MPSQMPLPLNRAVKLAGSEITCSCHACAFFSSADEQQAVLTPFMKDALEGNDRFVVCTYDLNRFSVSTVIDILRTHPQVIVGRALQQNPFFVPPDQFLAEIKARRRSA